MNDLLMRGAAARHTLDAGGLALMPGIVDNHTHYDAQATWDPYCTPSPALGVTAAVIGNCVSRSCRVVPCRPGPARPGDARLTTPAVWVRGVWLNGVPVADGNGNGVLEGAGAPPRLPGHLLRRFDA